MPGEEHTPRDRALSDATKPCYDASPTRKGTFECYRAITAQSALAGSGYNPRVEEDYNESLRASLHRLLDALFEEWSTTFCLAWTALMLGSIMFTNLWG